MMEKKNVERKEKMDAYVIPVEWNNANYRLFVESLISIGDEKYKEFNKSLVLNSKYEMIGIRVPVMRKMSKEIATNVYNEAVAATGLNGRGVKTLDIAMLSAVRVPAGLIEAGFMTNFEEAKLMLDPDYQKVIGMSATKGVSEFLNVQYIPIENENFPIIKVGSRGRFVRYLQFMLKIEGYNIGSVDGVFGPNTQNAVIAFQQANNLTPDGIVGPKTWESINLLNVEKTILKKGSTGSAVKYLQRKLYSKLYPVGTIDGIFGSNTERAVKEFQQENGLTPDGIVGPKTWQAVQDISTSRPFPQNQ